MTTERFIRRTMEDRGYEPDEIEDAVDAWAEERLNDRADRADRDMDERLEREGS